jgi:hypothetical protein
MAAMSAVPAVDTTGAQELPGELADARTTESRPAR